MSRKLVTIWERKRNECWEHNHVSDGYAKDTQTPAPISDEQRRAWAGAAWRKSAGILHRSVLRRMALWRARVESLLGSISLQLATMITIVC